MVMDILILAVLVLTIFFSMRKGFAMSVAGFFKGFASLIAAWVFCDDMAAWLMKSNVGTAITEKINQGLSVKWESSDIYMALPDLFKENGGNAAAGSLITEGSSKIASLLLTIICFAAIIFLLRVVLSLVRRICRHNGLDFRPFPGHNPRCDLRFCFSCLDCSCSGTVYAGALRNRHGLAGQLCYSG